MKEEGGPQKLVHTPDIRNPEKYPDCRNDLIGGAAIQTFAPGGKHPRAATDNNDNINSNSNTISVAL